MTRAERWRSLLVLLRDTFCRGNQAQLARLIGKDGSYVNRLFWPPEKKGAKGIGPEVVDACNRAFNLPSGYWDMHPGQAASALGEQAGFVPATLAPALHGSASLPQALEMLGQALMAADDLTLDQVRPLLARLVDEPTRAPEIVPRLAALLAGVSE